jgi:hypothetical protein
MASKNALKLQLKSRLIKGDPGRNLGLVVAGMMRP